MPLFSRTTNPQPTLVERHAAAQSLAAFALGTFADVADDLEAAAEAHRSVSDDAETQIQELFAVQTAADIAAEANATSANKVRSLFGL